MKLEEAIKIQTDLKRGYIYAGTQRQVDALQIGIEALKQLQDIRKSHFVYLTPLLPGETKE